MTARIGCCTQALRSYFEFKRTSNNLPAEPFVIRSCYATELSAVIALQRKCLLAAQWRESDYAQLISEPEGMVVVAASDGADARMAGTDPESTAQDSPLETQQPLLGFCAVRRIFDEAVIRNLAVDPAHQRKGIARMLLAHSHNSLRAAGAGHIYLEVRPSNSAARALYLSLGYQTQSIRKAYYRDPDEDAEIMSVEL
jgi:[ribosomal protein S18]-alanine N-acetyltransferase